MSIDLSKLTPLVDERVDDCYTGRILDRNGQELFFVNDDTLRARIVASINALGARMKFGISAVREEDGWVVRVKDKDMDASFWADNPLTAEADAGEWLTEKQTKEKV